MSLSPTRPLCVAVLVAVLVTGCGDDNPSRSEQPASAGQTRTSPPATSPPSVGGTPSSRPATPSPEGIERLPAKTILARAIAAATAAPSRRMQGTLTDGGDRMTIDLSSSGNAASVSVSSPSAGRVDIIVVGKAAYMRMSDKFLRSEARSKKEADAVITLLNGRWLSTSAKDPAVREMLEVGNPKMLFADMLRSQGRLRKRGPQLIDGVRSVGLSNGADVLWVDTITARPVRLQGAGKGTDFLAFSRYGQVPVIKAPPKSQTIDQKALAG